jgi:hypothetical protein
MVRRVDRPKVPHATSRRRLSTLRSAQASARRQNPRNKFPASSMHITYATRNPEGLSLKVSDEFTVPLCAIHHHHIHTTGKEQEWWLATRSKSLVLCGHRAASGIPQHAKLTCRNRWRTSTMRVLRGTKQATANPTWRRPLSPHLDPLDSANRRPYKAKPMLERASGNSIVLSGHGTRSHQTCLP